MNHQLPPSYTDITAANPPNQSPRFRSNTDDSLSPTNADPRPSLLPHDKIAKLFQDHSPHHVPVHEAEMQWPIESWIEFRTHDKVYSPSLLCGPYSFRLLVFPAGNGHHKNQQIAIYLQLDKDDHPDLQVPCDFVIGIFHPDNPSVSQFQHSFHRLGEVENDWGFGQFLSINELTKYVSRTPMTPAISSESTPSSADVQSPSSEMSHTNPASEKSNLTTHPSATAQPLNASHAHVPTGHGDVYKTVLMFKVRVLHDETGILFHSLRDYNSKKVTGYIGLKNQGATCYMNSILQSLFCTNYFRRAVYLIPPADVTPESPVPTQGTHSGSLDNMHGPSQYTVVKALQRLFYDMQTHEDASETNELTRSFGWNTVDAFAQHDVQEFLRVLCDNLEDKMKGTPADGMIQWLFVGKMKSFIKCVNVDYESARVEDFYDVQLNVKGMSNVADSFKNYIQVEMLEGDNKYMAEGHGLQDAEKGVVFTKFPPVLHLQLKRFEYDFMNDVMVKINDRFEFPAELDLDPFLTQEGGPFETSEIDTNSNPTMAGSQKYHLHGVLVHSGSVDAGHYCAFIRPTRADKWFKFDDDRVLPVPLREVLEENYGGDFSLPPGSRASRPAIQKRFTNAYMLVYIRESDYEKVLCPLSELDVPITVRDQVEKERHELEEQEREHLEREYMVTVRIIDDQTIRKYDEFDLWNFDNPLLTEWHQRVNKHKTVWRDIHSAFATHLGKQPDQLRFWLFTLRENKTERPDPENLLTCDQDNVSLADIMSKPRGPSVNSRCPWELRVYCEVAGSPWSESLIFPPAPGSPALVKAGLKSGTAMIFVKYFDVQSQTMSIVGHLHVSRLSIITEALPEMCTLAGLPSDSKLLVYEEVHQHMHPSINVSSTWKDEEMSDGDIVVIQLDHSGTGADVLPKSAQSQTPPPPYLASTGHLQTVPAYFEFLVNRIEVVFKPKPAPRDPSSASPVSVTAPTLPPEVRLTLSRTMLYDEVAQRLAHELSMDDPYKLRFTSVYAHDAPRLVIRRSPNLTLSDMVGNISSPMVSAGGYHRSPSISMALSSTIATGVLLYEKLSLSLTEMEQKRTIKVMCILPGKHDEVVELLVSKTLSLKQVGALIAEKLNVTGDKLHMNELIGYRLHREYDGREMLSQIPDYVILQAQVGPVAPTGASVVHHVVVVHMNKTPIQLHGVPFRFPVVANEPFAKTRVRLQQYLGWSDKDMTRAPIKLIPIGTALESPLKVSEPGDSDKLSDLLLVQGRHPSNENVTLHSPFANEKDRNELTNAGTDSVPPDDPPHHEVGAPPVVYNTGILLALDHPARRTSRFVSGLERAVKIFN